MDTFSLIFVLGMFTPGLIRGAFWYDTPAVEGIGWTFATIPIVLFSGWLAELIFGSGLGPTIVMVLVVIFINLYALKGANFLSGTNSNYYDIDGDANE